MQFIVSSIFTKHVYEYVSENEYLGLQSFLLQYLEAGKVIPGSAGVRKVRWATPEKGKSGGFGLFTISRDKIKKTDFLLYTVRVK
jgi:hypothetical protein